MTHPRRFLCPTSLESPPWELSAAEARHASKALRLRVGDEATLMDGEGGTVRVRFAHLERDRAVVEPCAGPSRDAPPALRPWLVVGAPEPPTLDPVVEHAVELGAWRIAVVRAARTPVPLAALERRLERWESLVRSAGKQSGNPWFPRVLLFGSVEEACNALPPGGFLLSQDAPALAPSCGISGDIVLAVGPEGDFSPEEARCLAAHGLAGASLARHTLRVETACLSALAVVAALGRPPLDGPPV